MSNIGSVLSAFDSYAATPAAFYFSVVIGDASTLGSDNSFQEVSGITTEIETEPFAEGGNQYVLNLPTKINHPNLVLQRGIALSTSPLVVWCSATMGTDFGTPILPKPVNVYLMGAYSIPIRGWSFLNAYPVKWEVESAIESIALSYMQSSRIL